LSGKHAIEGTCSSASSLIARRRDGLADQGEELRAGLPAPPREEQTSNCRGIKALEAIARLSNGRVERNRLLEAGYCLLLASERREDLGACRQRDGKPPISGNCPLGVAQCLLELAGPEQSIGAAVENDGVVWLEL
jgi:hypothetical protein